MSYIGEDKLDTMYLGDTKIAKAYLGSDLVFDSSGGGQVLPYTPLTWVGNTDNTNYKVFINIQFTKNTTFNYDFLPRNNANWWTAFKISRPDALWASDKQMFCMQRDGSTNSYIIFYFNTTANISTNFASDHHIVVDSTGVKLNGGSYGKTFSTKSDAPQGSEWFIGFTKFYSFTAYENGVLVADIIPVLYEGNYGLWDRVTDTFITPDSGTLIGE